jgi:CheY-like chemotaxis protein
VLRRNLAGCRQCLNGSRRIVDDESLNITLLKRILVDEQNCVVSEAHLGEEALKLVASAPPDLILLDITCSASLVLRC